MNLPDEITSHPEPSTQAHLANLAWNAGVPVRMKPPNGRIALLDDMA